MERVREIIADCLFVPIERVIPQASFKYDLGADSLDMMEILLFLEDEYDIEIPDEDVVAIETVKQIILYIEKRLKEIK